MKQEPSWEWQEIPAEPAPKHPPRRSPLRMVLALMLAASLLGLGVLWLQRYRANRAYDQLQQNNRPASSAAQSASSAFSQPQAELQIPVAFDELKKKNADTYAWIYIPGTKVDYPMLQNAQFTDYYLEHTFDRSYGLPGAIYTRNDTAKDFSDPCTIVYGHNMKDDSMFGSLHDYEKQRFFKDPANRTIETYTPDAIRRWTIFAAVEYSDVLLTAAYDFTDPQQKLAFVESLRSCRGHFDAGVPVTETDRLIVLSTCIGGKETSRYLVVGVLTEEQTEAAR